MSIYAEGIDNAIAFLSCLYRFEEGGPFVQTVLAMTKEEILVYNDNAPDKQEGADWSYKVKIRFPLKFIELATNEVIESRRKINVKTNRLTLNVKDGEEKKTYNFFYYDDSRSYAYNIIAGLKKYSVKTKNIKTKLSY